MTFFPEEWGPIFTVKTPVFELFLRGTLLYLAILAFLRVLPRRTGAELAITDLVFVLIVAEAAAHAMGAYESVTEGLIVVATLIGWNYLLNVLSFHFKFVERLTSAGPLPTIAGIRRAMKFVALMTANKILVKRT